ncbi:hypothetical protein A2U01_0102540, partial [Trifolium medium]|nr:hypothetical protein [Trifolium medium]
MESSGRSSVKERVARQTQRSGRRSSRSSVFVKERVTERSGFFEDDGKEMRDEGVEM